MLLCLIFRINNEYIYEISTNLTITNDQSLPRPRHTYNYIQRQHINDSAIVSTFQRIFTTHTEK